MRRTEREEGDETEVLHDLRYAAVEGGEPVSPRPVSPVLRREGGREHRCARRFAAVFGGWAVSVAAQQCAGRRRRKAPWGGCEDIRRAQD